MMSNPEDVPPWERPIPPRPANWRLVEMSMQESGVYHWYRNEAPRHRGVLRLTICGIWEVTAMYFRDNPSTAQCDRCFRWYDAFRARQRTKTPRRGKGW